MTRVLDIRPVAEREFREAYRWYEEKNSRLGASFLQEVDSVLQTVARNPNLYPILYRDVHRVILKRFPYGVFYRADDAMIQVLAVFHTARDPSNWPS
jgi:plasmid stabilization system protein ParE